MNQEKDIPLGLVELLALPLTTKGSIPPGQGTKNLEGEERNPETERIGEIDRYYSRQQEEFFSDESSGRDTRRGSTRRNYGSKSYGYRETS